MFFRRGKEADTGSTPSENTKKERNVMKDDFPFSEYIGEDEARRLFLGEDDSDEDISLGLEEIKEELDEIKEELNEITIQEPEPWPMNPTGIKLSQPVPPILPPRQGEASVNKNAKDDVEVPMTPKRIYQPPQVSIPKGMPKIPMPKVPMPKMPMPPIPPLDVKSRIKHKKDIDLDFEMKDSSEEKPTDDKKIKWADFEKVQDSLTDFVKTLEGLNSDIMSRVNALEDAVINRSKEIKDEAKQAFDDAIERARKIKEVMHESELKNLEIQEKTMELFNKQEDRIASRGEQFSRLYPTN
jgi:hypothetical protein